MPSWSFGPSGLADSGDSLFLSSVLESFPNAEPAVMLINPPCFYPPLLSVLPTLSSTLAEL